METDQQRKERTGLSSLQTTDDASKAVQKTPYRIALSYIEARIKEYEFIHPASAPHMTICVVELDNNYLLVGKSVPADPENFNLELGHKFAYEDAIRQAWPLFAFGLREALTTTISRRTWRAYRPWMRAVILLLMLTSPAGAHDWYTGKVDPVTSHDCCGDKDCRPVKQSSVTPLGGGSYSWRGIKILEPRVQRSPDNQFHVCSFTVYADSFHREHGASPHLDMTTKVLCFFAPDLVN